MAHNSLLVRHRGTYSHHSRSYLDEPPCPAPFDAHWSSHQQRRFPTSFRPSGGSGSSARRGSSTIGCSELARPRRDSRRQRDRFRRAPRGSFLTNAEAVKGAIDRWRLRRQLLYVPLQLSLGVRPRTTERRGASVEERGASRLAYTPRRRSRTGPCMPGQLRPCALAHRGPEIPTQSLGWAWRVPSRVSRSVSAGPIRPHTPTPEPPPSDDRDAGPRLGPPPAWPRPNTRCSRQSGPPSSTLLITPWPLCG